jgi:hypothetical protein
MSKLMGFIHLSHSYNAREVYDIKMPVIQHPEPCVNCVNKYIWVKIFLMTKLLI